MSEWNPKRFISNGSERVEGSPRRDRSKRASEHSDDAHAELIRSIGFTRKELRRFGAAAVLLAGIVGSEHEPANSSTNVPQREITTSLHAAETSNPEVMQKDLIAAVGKTIFESQFSTNASASEAGRLDQESREALRVNIEGSTGHEAYDDALRRVVAETYPQSWTTADHVSSVALIEPVALGQHVQGRCVRSFNESCRIEISSSPDHDTVRILNREFAHATAFGRTNGVTHEQTVAFAHRILHRVSSPDRIRFHDAETNKDADPRINTMLRMKAYWASLMELGLQIPASTEADWDRRFIERIEELHQSDEVVMGSEQTDLQLVKDAFRVMDPEYQPWKAAKRQTDIVSDGARKELIHQIEGTLSSIHHPALRMMLQERLQAGRGQYDAEEYLFLNQAHHGMHPELIPSTRQIGFVEGLAHLQGEIAKQEQMLDANEQHLFAIYQQLFTVIDNIRQSQRLMFQDLRSERWHTEAQRLVERLTDALDGQDERQAHLVRACDAYPDIVRSAAQVVQSSPVHMDYGLEAHPASWYQSNQDRSVRSRTPRGI